MKNIQEIIKEMEKISEHVATTVNEEPLTPERAEEELANIINAEPAALNDPILGTSCCIVSVPNEFTVPVTSPVDPTIPVTNQNILFTTTQLSCFVNPTTISCTPPDCPTPIDVTVFEVRLSGCIPYIVNVSGITGPVAVPPVTCEAVPGTTRICCSDTFCVNSRIGIYATLPEALAICNNTALLTCNNIQVGLVSTLVETCGGNGQAIQFEVTFNSLLGNCPPPTPPPPVE
ncbi:hypothetical protein ACPWSR_08375 [Alloiococcus sp. CFN-8]|uniref:hypothetical protein n=1 Tax=Alloiococcus sp. CFN-8 TaxID=3416081 RepID=UPI003CF1EEDF